MAKKQNKKKKKQNKKKEKTKQNKRTHFKFMSHIYFPMVRKQSSFQTQKVEETEKRNPMLTTAETKKDAYKFSQYEIQITTVGSIKIAYNCCYE